MKTYFVLAVLMGIVSMPLWGVEGYRTSGCLKMNSLQPGWQWSQNNIDDCDDSISSITPRLYPKQTFLDSLKFVSPDHYMAADACISESFSSNTGVLCSGEKCACSCFVREEGGVFASGKLVVLPNQTYCQSSEQLSENYFLAISEMNHHSIALDWRQCFSVRDIDWQLTWKEYIMLTVMVAVPVNFFIDHYKQWNILLMPVGAVFMLMDYAYRSVTGSI